MNTSIIILALVFAMSAPANTEKQSNKAEQIIERYLKFPHPEDSFLDKNRSDRLTVLDELKSMPDEAVDAIGQVLPNINNHQQRMELIEKLGYDLQTKKSAEILCGMLKDPNEWIRGQVIFSLRRLSMRTNRTGISRKQFTLVAANKNEQEQTSRDTIRALRAGTSYSNVKYIEPLNERFENYVEYAPKVEGLVPYLVTAANDPVERNRITALFVLADTRDSLAVAEIRNRLKDSSEKVRLYAASFLTEYQDASGLLEMQRVLSRLSTTEPGPVDEFDYYGQAEMIMASYERITGKSFGQIPMDPHLSSSTTTQEKIRKTYKALLNYWSQWLSWQPMPID
jgi:hypothetical protein